MYLQHALQIEFWKENYKKDSFKKLRICLKYYSSKQADILKYWHLLCLNMTAVEEFAACIAYF